MFGLHAGVLTKDLAAAPRVQGCAACFHRHTQTQTSTHYTTVQLSFNTSQTYHFTAELHNMKTMLLDMTFWMDTVSPNFGIMVNWWLSCTSLWLSTNQCRQRVVTCCWWHSLCYKGPIANVDYTADITACVIKAMYNTSVTVYINSHYKNVIDKKIHWSINQLIPNIYSTKDRAHLVWLSLR